MTRVETIETNHDEIALLAYLNWQMDGSPPGRDLDYWLEAESLIKATKPLLADECEPETTRKSASKKIRFRSNGPLKTPARRELARQL